MCACCHQLTSTTRRLLFTQLFILTLATVAMLGVFAFLSYPYLTRCAERSRSGVVTYCNVWEVAGWISCLVVIALLYAAAVVYVLYTSVTSLESLQGWRSERKVTAGSRPNSVSPAVKQRRYQPKKSDKFHIESHAKSSESYKSVSELVMRTWEAAIEGSPGNQRDGFNLYHNQISIKHIYEITNKTLLEHYHKTFAPEVSVDVELSDCNKTLRPEANADVVIAESLNSGDVLDAGDTSKGYEEMGCSQPPLSLASEQFNAHTSHVFPSVCRSGEAYLFHGCRADHVTDVTLHGFTQTREVQPGVQVGGVRLHEGAEGADQLADSKLTRHDHELFMILTRVNLGLIRRQCTRDDCPECSSASARALYDSEVTGCWNSFRQVLVRDASRCYPHYVIEYDRGFSRRCESTGL